MRSRSGRHGVLRATSAGAVFGLLLIVGPTLAADGPAKTPTPEQIRARMAKVRAELGQRRPATGRATLPAARKPALPSGSAPRQPVEYRLRAGDVFAYHVEATSGREGSGAVEGVRGTPYVSVHSVDREGLAELFVIGKLEGFTRDDGGREKSDPERTVWIGSRVGIEPNGNWVGKEDVNASAMPLFFRTLSLKPKRLILPQLPRTLPSVDDTSTNGTLFVQLKTTSVPGALPGILPGKAVVRRHADPEGPSAARLTHDVDFETNPNVRPHVRITYRSWGRFDRAVGRMISWDASYRQEQDGERTLVGTVRVRPVQGEGALAQAHSQASADWSERPQGFDPFEFQRVHVTPFLPTHLKSVREAPSGTTLYHLRGTNQSFFDADNKYYEVVSLGVDSADGTRVRIRYNGSGEILAVKPQTLAHPPGAPKPPYTTDPMQPRS